MTIQQFNACRSVLERCSSRSEFIERFPGMDPGELIDVWTLLHGEPYTFAAIRRFAGLTQAEFSSRYNVPQPTIESWSARNGKRNIAEYTLDLFAVDVINARSAGV